MRRATSRSVLLLLALAGAGCQKHESQELAPAASALAPAKPAAPKAVTLEVERASSKLTFTMEAAIEKISGEAPGALEGQLFVDLEDITKSTGLVRVDLDKLMLYQEQRKDEKQSFSEKKKNALQNQHARTWLEISEDTPDDVRQANRFAEFKITRIENPSTLNLLAKDGHDQAITATVVGDFRLHGRKSEKRANVRLSFAVAAGKLEAMTVETTSPLAIGLEEFDVRPREAFGKLAQKTLDALGSKVAKVLPLELAFSARAK